MCYSGLSTPVILPPSAILRPQTRLAYSKCQFKGVHICIWYFQLFKTTLIFNIFNTTLNDLFTGYYYSCCCCYFYYSYYSYSSSSSSSSSYYYYYYYYYLLLSEKLVLVGDLITFSDIYPKNFFQLTISENIAGCVPAVVSLITPAG